MSFTRDFNEGVRQRGQRMLSEGLDHMLSMGVKDRGELFKKARYRVKYRDNEAELIQLIMPRYGFIQMTQGGLGSTVDPSTKKRTGGTPRPFLRKAVEARQEELGDYVARMFADRATGDINIGVRY